MVTHVLKSNGFIKLAGGFPKMFTSQISTTKGFFNMETYQGFRERFPKDADTWRLPKDAKEARFPKDANVPMLFPKDAKEARFSKMQTYRGFLEMQTYQGFPQMQPHQIFPKMQA